MPTFFVYRELSAIKMPGGRVMRASDPAPVLGVNGKPLRYADLRAADRAADAFNTANRRGAGGTHCVNITYFAGWRP